MYINLTIPHNHLQEELTLAPPYYYFKNMTQSLNFKIHILKNKDVPPYAIVGGNPAKNSFFLYKIIAKRIFLSPVFPLRVRYTERRSKTAPGRFERI